MESTTQDEKPAKNGNKLWILPLIVAVITPFTDKAPWSLLISCGFLLFAWSQYFYAGPGLNLTPKQIHQFYRFSPRRISPKYVRTANLLSIILFAIGELGQHGLL